MIRFDEFLYIIMFKDFNHESRLLQIFMASTREEKAALLPGIQAEVEAITSDVSEFVSNLNVVLYRLYPIFDCEVTAYRLFSATLC